MVHTTTIRRLDAEKRPCEIDMEITDKDGKNPRIARGIYAVDENTLTYCIALPGKPRPKTFAKTNDIGRTLVILKRVKSQADPESSPTSNGGKAVSPQTGVEPSASVTKIRKP